MKTPLLKVRKNVIWRHYFDQTAPRTSEHEMELRISPMAFSESFLSNAGWLFFAAWTAVIAAITIAAFGRDLLPWSTHLDSPPKSSRRSKSAPPPANT